MLEILLENLLSELYNTGYNDILIFLFEKIFIYKWVYYMKSIVFLKFLERIIRLLLEKDFRRLWRLND